MPKKTERRHQQGDESRQRIIAATLVIASERGYEGTTVALVTERTGLPASSVYWHFKNKDELLAETLEYSYRRWRTSSPTWDNGIEPVGLSEQIHTRLHRASKAIVDSPEFWRLGLMLGLERRLKEPEARRRYILVREETQNAIALWWRKILPLEIVDADDALPVRLARFHLAAMDGLYVGVRADRGWDLDVLVDMIAAGMYAHVLAKIEAVA